MDPQDTFPHGPTPTLGDLARANLRIALHSFGGAAPWAYRVYVEERGWLTPAEFAEAWGLCQVVPGPNVVSLSLWIGDRSRGLAGALVSFAGILVAPTVIACVLDAALVRSAHIHAVDHALAGLALAAAGLILALGAKLARPLVRVLDGRGAAQLALAAAAFVAVALLRLPVLAVVAVLAPLGVALAPEVTR